MLDEEFTHAERPVLAAFENGDFLVSWVSQEGHRTEGSEVISRIFAQKYTAFGDPIGSPILIAEQSLHSGFAINDPSITTKTDGGFAVAWTDHEGKAFIQEHDPSGVLAKGPALVSETPNLGDRIPNPGIVELENGGYALLWTSEKQPKVYTLNSDLNPVPNTITFPYQAYFGLSGGIFPLSDGGFVVSTLPRVSTKPQYRIDLNVFSGSGSEVSSMYGLDVAISGARLAELGNGMLVAVWADSSYNSITAQLIDSSFKRVGSSFTVSDDSLVYNPHVVAVGDDKFAVTWNHRGHDNVFIKVFDADGTAITDTLSVAQDGAHDAVLAALPTGLILVWATRDKTDPDSENQLDKRLITYEELGFSLGPYPPPPPGPGDHDISYTEFPTPDVFDVNFDYANTLREMGVFRDGKFTVASSSAVWLYGATARLPDDYGLEEIATASFSNDAKVIYEGEIFIVRSEDRFMIARVEDARSRNHGDEISGVSISVLGEGRFNVKDPAVITGDTVGLVIEDDMDRQQVGGVLTVTAPDTGEGGFASLHSAALAGLYGNFTFDPDTGVWSYTLDNESSVVQSLPGDVAVADYLFVSSVDGTALERVAVTIQGVDDDRPSYEELLVPDVFEMEFAVTSTLWDLGVFADGKFSVAGGSSVWLYGAATARLPSDLDTAEIANVRLSSKPKMIFEGEEFIVRHEDTFVIARVDDAKSAVHGDAFSGVSISVLGKGRFNGNDPASITGDIEGLVVEDDVERQQASGLLAITDADAGEDRFASPDPASLAGHYGAFAFDPITGVWSYTLDNESDSVQSLPDGVEVTDRLTVSSFDGTASETITVTIRGVNDPASITGDTTGLVVAGDADRQQASGVLKVIDPDAGEARFHPAQVLLAGSTNLPKGTDVVVTADFDHPGNIYQAGNLFFQYAYMGNQPVIFSAFAGDAESSWNNWDSGVDILEYVSFVGDQWNNTITVSSNAGISDQDIIIYIQGNQDVAHYVYPWFGVQVSLSVFESELGAYGSFSFDRETGAWTYVLDNHRESVQSLPDGVEVTDRWTVTSLDGTASETITVTILGAADMPPNGGPTSELSVSISDRKGMSLTDVRVEVFITQAGDGIQARLSSLGEISRVDLLLPPGEIPAAIDFTILDTNSLSNFRLGSMFDGWTVQGNQSSENTVSVSGFGPLGADIQRDEETILASFDTTRVDPTDLIGFSLIDVMFGSNNIEDRTFSAEMANTDADGNSVFEIASGSDVIGAASLEFINTSQPGAGRPITAQDALEALRLAVGLNPTYGVADPYAFIAADFNRDGRVTAQDALEILRYAVRLPDAIQAEWTFVDSEQDLSHISRRDVSFEEGFRIENTAMNTEISLVGILLGDVNASYVA